jgi:deoxyadenosine/deoxycytidine kinase
MSVQQRGVEIESSRQILELNVGNVAPRDADQRRYLAVAGNIGAGKSTLVEFLCERYDLLPYFEPNEANPYLEDFYKDMKRWAFSSQMYFLGAKFRLHTELEAHQGHVLQDRTIWEDAEIFAYNLYKQKIMNERDWKSYWMFYETIRDQLRPPDLMIYLRCPVRTVQQRIQVRGRQMEQNIPAAYLKRLHTLYEDWIGRYSLSPVLVIPTDKLDYMTDLVDRHDILTSIEKYIL